MIRIALILFIVSIFLPVNDSFGELISPGKLTESHSKIKGLKNCVKCHKLRKGIPDSACKSCHKALVKRINKNKGFHSTVKDGCIKCHTEHKGVGYDIASFNKKKFDHKKTGYELKGGHKISCEKCHKKEKTFLGLSTKCLDCHTDVHKKSLSADCLKCHSYKDWKSLNFNHDKYSKYKLTGKHRKAKCEGCHPSQLVKGTLKDKGKTFKTFKFKPLTFKKCNDCHKDIHKGKLKEKSCKSCHNTSDWKKTAFDHKDPKLSEYRLEGKHEKVACELCHQSKKVLLTYKGKKVSRLVKTLKPLKHDRCIDCHFDIHKGQFKGQRCDTCHSVKKEWKKQSFNHDSKQYKGYKLEGKHADVKCDKCHQQSRVKYKEFGKNKKVVTGKFKPVEHSKCTDCHFDIHKGQFKGQKCDACHSVKKEWKKQSFNHDSKQYKGYKLEGKHADVKCDKCHQQSRVKYKEFGKNKKVVTGKFKPVEHSKCTDCHFDIHKGQFKNQKCDTCHSVKKEWKKQNFNHDSKEYKGYKLEGKHRDVKCDKCHKKWEVKFKEFQKSKKVTVGFFKPIPSEKCTDCHKDVHKGEYKNPCKECHSPYSWEPKKFLHDPSSFDLKGAHRNVNCRECHMDAKNYKGLNSDCFTCHQGPHLSQFGSFCNDCHRQSTWIPTNFKHTDVGFRLAGGHRAASCDDCHINRDYRNTPTDCLSCHQSNYQSAPEHISQNYSPDCTKCHRTSGYWGQVTYNHTGFSYKGAHFAIKNDCEACHSTPGQPPVGTTDDDCYNCHSTSGVAGSSYEKTSSPSHAELTFSTSCTDCHNNNAWSPANYTHRSFNTTGMHATLDCASCHQSGYPGQYAGVTDDDCYSCHVANYQSASNHVATNYPQDCTQCHSSSSWSGATSYSHATFNFTGVHLALKNDCSNCHGSVQPVAGTTDSDCYNCHSAAGVASSSYEQTSSPSHTELAFSTSCTDCHSKNAWSPANYAHRSFNTTGIHATLDCTSCHQSGYPGQYVGTTDDDCYACHAANYQSAPNHVATNYPQDCTQCHSSSSWSGATSYSHTTFNFTGVHLALKNDCSNCHGSVQPLAGTTDSDCYNCHSAAGVASSSYEQTSSPSHTELAFSTSCTDCHSKNAWSPANYTHRSFNTTGIHATLDCASCHQSGYPGQYVGTTDDDCYACHAANYQSAPNHVATNYPQDCTQCHSSSSWSGATNYSHATFNFTGVHLALKNDCSNCHGSVQPVAGTTDSDCYNCHSASGVASSSYEQTSSPSHTELAFSTSCTDCHSNNAWSPANYAHRSFNTTGIHATLNCASCHQNGYPGQYVGTTDDDCYACHESDYTSAANHTRFNYPQDCTTCHSQNTWAGASFTHQNFQLRGIHASTDCYQCHKTGYPGEYAGVTDDNCFACHEANYYEEHSTCSYDCTLCHNLFNWDDANNKNGCK